jgi:hypothetical protein
MNFLVQKMEYIFMMKDFKFMNLQFDVHAISNSFRLRKLDSSILHGYGNTKPQMTMKINKKLNDTFSVIQTHEVL